MNTDAPLPNRRAPWLGTIACLLIGLGAFAGCSSDAPNTPDLDDGDGDVTVSGRLALSESDIRASAVGDVVQVDIPVEVEGASTPALSGTVTLRTLAGDDVASASAEVDGEVLSFRFAGLDDVPASTADAGPLADLVIHYDVRADDARIHGRRSLFTAWRKQSIRVLSTDTFDADGQSYVRVIVADDVSGAPIVEADVRVSFVDDDGALVSVADAVTDAFGVAAVAVAPGGDLVGDRDMLVEVEPGDGTAERLTARVAVTRDQRVMVTTDKPLYQPGQTIHIRTLTLGRSTLGPAADAPVTIEIEDAEGNKIGRIEGRTDAFGVASAEFVLARELNMGTWTIAATVAGVTTERAVTVERYVLPKFNLVAQPDRAYFRPGDTAEFFIDAQYFFGQPVSGGTVLVEPYTFDVGFNALPTIEATLDDDGIARVQVPVPDFLVGLPLEQGGTFLRVDVSVTDAAEHTQTVTKNLPVVEGDVTITLIPASSIVPGADNRFYVITTDPVGRAVASTGTVSYGDDVVAFETDARGIALATVRPGPDATRTVITVSATTDAGTGSRTFEFDTGFAAEHGAISLQADKAVYEVGESIRYDIITGDGVPRVFVDVIRQGQTLRTETVELSAGRATGTLDLSADMTGTLQVEAYLVTTDGHIVRGDTLVWVEDASGLGVSLTTPQATYRPGEDGQIDVEVTDEDGEGVVAAVGLTVVDEAVFALQDARPGLERIFFQIEDELLNPQYNLYSLSFESVIAPPEGVDDAERDRAAAILLAASDSAGYPVQIDSLGGAYSAASALARAHFSTDRQRISDKFRAMREAGLFDEDVWSYPAEVAQLLESFPAMHDAWGRAMRFTTEGNDNSVWSVTAHSAGLDETWDTDDDLSQRFDTWELSYDAQDGRNDWDDDMFAGADAGAGPPEPSPEVPGEGGGGEGGSDAPRVRSYFPETLLVEPAIITDADGRASVPLTLADSITTWRMTGTANTADGQLGSGTGSVLVFQDFFVDINFPVSLTQNDVVSVPIALFNYLEEPQTVSLEVDLAASGDWFTLLSDASIDVALEAGEVTVRYFDVQVDDVGWNAFQVTAIGSSESDAIRRVVEVVPDGQEQLVVFSDRLNGDVSRTVTIPETAIDNASALFVKLYPGLFSQVIEGLDSLLQMPSGCFEQTSSTTYPNILVLQYLIESGTSTPELEMLATEYISQGYQRLVSYEVTGGGFEWFGNDPAHRILTAYGLLEFSDMSEVFPVDPAILTRTREWLISQQEADGRWMAAPEGIHEGATNNFQDSDLRATAYITYALLESGDNSSATLRGVEWVRANLGDADDAYTLGLVANMFLAADRSDSTARDILAQLDASKQSEETDSGTIFWWESGSQSLYYGTGPGMHMEATAFILQAYIRAGVYPTTIDGVVGYLIQNKGEFGQFSSTQATIHALRAFIMLMSEATTSGDADIAVYLGDVLIDEVSIDEASSDLMRQFDLRDLVIEGDNEVRIEVEGEGEFLYQIVGRYYLPWELVETEGPTDVLTIDVSYDRTELAVDETVGVTAVVSNASNARMDMVMLDLGVPPGFDVVMSDFDRYIEDPDVPVSRVERAGRQLTVYLYGLDADEVVTLEYALRATMPMEVSTPPSAAWLYYDASVRTEDEPTTLTVN